MNGYLGDIMRAIGFLSRIPVPARFFDGGAFRQTRMVGAFPAAGFIISLPAACLLFLLATLGVGPLFAAFSALAVQTLITGALHEDGLADTADGFWGGRDRQRILEIMHDSRSGAYGVTALILTFGLRASALASIMTHTTPGKAAAALLAAETLSRAAIVVHWALSDPARPDGVAASAGKPEKEAVIIALVSSGVMSVLLGYFAGGLFAALLLPAAALAVAYGFTELAENKIGGHTGDTLGASQQLSLLAVLFAATIVQ